MTDDPQGALDHVAVFLADFRGSSVVEKAMHARNMLREISLGVMSSLTERERVLIGTLNPNVLGQELVDAIQRATGVSPKSFKPEADVLVEQPDGSMKRIYSTDKGYVQ